jgi:hypothetical protein
MSQSLDMRAGFLADRCFAKGEGWEGDEEVPGPVSLER